MTNDLGRPISDVVLTVSVPGTDVLSARVPSGGSCSETESVRCAVGTLDPGEVATIRIRLRPLDQGTLRPLVTVRGDGVPAQRIRLGPVRVKAGPARLIVRKSTAVRLRRARAADQVSDSRGRGPPRGGRAAGARLRSPGSGLRLRSASRGGVLRDGRACWRLGRLLPGRRRRVTVVAEVTGRAGVVRNVAGARSTNLRRKRPVRSIAAVRVLTGVCASAAGPQARAAC